MDEIDVRVFLAADFLQQKCQIFMEILLGVHLEPSMSVKILHTFLFVSDWFWQLGTIHILQDKLESIREAAIRKTDIRGFFKYARSWSQLIFELLLEISLIVVQKFFSSTNFSVRENDNFEFSIDHTFERSAIKFCARINQLNKRDVTEGTYLKTFVQVHRHILAFEENSLAYWPNISPILSDKHVLLNIFDGHQTNPTIAIMAIPRKHDQQWTEILALLVEIVLRQMDSRNILRHGSDLDVRFSERSIGHIEPPSMKQKPNLIEQMIISVYVLCWHF